MDTGRAKEHQHVVIVDFYHILKVGRDSAEHHGFGEVELSGGQQVDGGIGADVGAAVEILLVLVLLHDVNEVVEGLVAIENLTLTVLHITLQVERRGFVDAEIF